MLQDIINHHLPPKWKSFEYTSEHYELVDLEDSDPEYQQVTNTFEGMEIARVVRVQNPFIYGRFKIRKEYLSLSRNVEETTKYHPVLATDVAKVAEHNCDPRRYTTQDYYTQRDDKNPKFYQTPSHAFSTFRGVNKSGDIAIVVVKLLDNDNSWESQYYPEYVVYIQ